MLLDKTKWFIKGTLAICILAGAVSIDGEIVRAQGKADPREDEIDDYFLPTDANSDTKVSWEECLFRERTASAERDKAKTPEASKRWLVKYQWRLDREEFLHADQNDDLSLTRSEWRTWLDKDFGEEGPPALSRKDLLTLAIAAVDEQWGALMADADTDKDQKLSAPEIRNHFIRSYAAESDDKKSNAKSFTDADKDQDNRLDKSEYAQFSANEAHRGDEYYIGYLITHGFAASDKETGVVAKKLNAVEIGTVWFKKVADTRKEKKDMGAQDTAPPASYSYYRYKITAKSALGFKSIGLPCSSDLIVTNKSDKSVADYTWDKGCEPKSEIIEMVKVGDVELECYVYETGGSAEGAKPQPSEKKWVLTTCPIIVVKHIKDGQVIEETVKFGE